MSYFYEKADFVESLWNVLAKHCNLVVQNNMFDFAGSAKRKKQIYELQKSKVCKFIELFLARINLTDKLKSFIIGQWQLHIASINWVPFFQASVWGQVQDSIRKTFVNICRDIDLEFNKYLDDVSDEAKAFGYFFTKISAQVESSQFAYVDSAENQQQNLYKTFLDRLNERFDPKKHDYLEKFLFLIGYLALLIKDRARCFQQGGQSLQFYLAEQLQIINSNIANRFLRSSYRYEPNQAQTSVALKLKIRTVFYNNNTFLYLDYYHLYFDLYIQDYGIYPKFYLA
jgi:hypothetical protein